MSTKKAGAGGVRQQQNVPGKRLGVKIYGGQKIKSGMIIVRQNGTIIHPGKNTRIGRDFTIFAIKSGLVSYKKMTGSKRGKKRVEVLPITKSKKKTSKE